MEKARKHGESLFIMFINLKKAYREACELS